METVILVVEDEPLVALEIQEQLQHCGYRVPRIVRQGSEALAAINELHPDLVMMDIRISGKIDGIEVARLIRKEHDLPLVYLTAFSDRETIERAAATEPDGYLIKPFSERELLANVGLAIEKHRLRQLDGKQLASYVPVIDALEKPAVLFDVNGRIFHFNLAALLVLGMPDQQGFSGQSLADLIDQARKPDDGIFETSHNLKESLLSTQAQRLRLEHLRDRTGQRRGLIGFIEPVSSAEHRIIDSSLQTAASALQQLTPPDGSLKPALDHASFLLPCPSGAGDLSDVFQLDEHLYVFYNMDVMGHGTLPSLIAYSLHGRIRLIAQGVARASQDNLTPSAILNALNHHYQSGSETGTFFTIALGILDISTGLWSLARAGHPYSLLACAHGGCNLIEAQGMALGAFDTIHLEESHGIMEQGDRMILCSDGLLEFLSPAGSEAAYQVISSYADKHQLETPAALAAALRAFCRTHTPEKFDDASLLVVEYLGRPPA